MHPTRLLVTGGLAGVLAVAALAPPASAATSPSKPSRPSSSEKVLYQRLLVTGDPGQADLVSGDVTALGGRWLTHLDVVQGGLVVLPASAVGRLRGAPGVRSVSPDGAGHLMGVDPSLGYDAAGDEGSLFDIAQITHARDAWAKNITGKGVDVALIDSGVSAVPGLTSGNVVNGPDLSFESQDPDLVHKDTFGHGTHMASIIAGRDAVASGGTYANAGSHKFTGIAPDARLVSLKVASSDGGSDVSQVIAAIDWVTQHAHDPGMNIRVLNLSYGTDSVQDPSVDPLVYAAENAWRAGIVVVAASGNNGANRAAVADPAISPLVLAVGAEDPTNTDSVGDDTIPSFAQRGTTARPVDLVAPGVHVLGLRDPGGSIDQANPGARVGTRFFRGSGTSQSTAVVSGLAALYLSKYPSSTPDQVKRALMSAATPLKTGKSAIAGVGVPDVNKAIGAPVPPASAPSVTGATGLGTLEGARGTVHVDGGNGALTGEQDVFGTAWQPAAWAAASSAGTAWSGGTWNTDAWAADDWTAVAGLLSWDSHAWSGNDWTSHAWSSHAWSSHAWSDSGWDSHAWSDSAWASHAWSSSAWSDSAWSTSGWQSSAWG